MAKAKPKTENRGGARPNSGPKKETLSVRQVKEMRKRADAYAKKYGKTIDEILLDFVYGVAEFNLSIDEGEGETVESVIAKKVSTRDRIACIKLWKEYTSPKITEGGPADTELGPKVYLPQHVEEGTVIPIDR